MNNEMVISKKIFHKDFNSSILGHFKAAVGHGYIMANTCINDNDFLKTFVGSRNRANLINTAIEYALKDRIERFELKVNIEEANNSKGTFPHYNFLVGDAIFTVSRTSSYGDLPRQAIFRNVNSSLNSQTRMTFEKNVLELPLDLEGIDQYYTILTFGGHSQLEFMHFGIPNDKIDSWLYQYNLGYAITPVDETSVKEEIIPESSTLALKDEFIKRKQGSVK